MSWKFALTLSDKIHQIKQKFWAPVAMKGDIATIEML